MAPHWRGGEYAILERRSPARVVLLYASEWDDAAAASRYFKLYRKVLETKWKRMEVSTDNDGALAGTGDDGCFLLVLSGNLVTSIEGAESPLPLR